MGRTERMSTDETATGRVGRGRWISSIIYWWTGARRISGRLWCGILGLRLWMCVHNHRVSLVGSWLGDGISADYFWNKNTGLANEHKKTLLRVWRSQETTRPDISQLRGCCTAITAQEHFASVSTQVSWEEEGGVAVFLKVSMHPFKIQLPLRHCS